jgi:small subunit ribosomal protein S19e
MTIYDTDPQELVEELAKELRNIDTLQPPEWAGLVKTGASRERPPQRTDWWFVRAASILRKIRLKGPIGVGKLRTLYGGLKNRGHKPEQFRKSSGNIIRKIIQQLEKAELVKAGNKGVHKGRIITPKGIKLMEKVAKSMVKIKPAPKLKAAEPKVEEQQKKEASSQENG